MSDFFGSLLFLNFPMIPDTVVLYLQFCGRKSNFQLLFEPGLEQHRMRAKFSGKIIQQRNREKIVFIKNRLLTSTLKISLPQFAGY
jgi:hypothetical protein